MHKRKKTKGDAFLPEKTGSAPLVNLDGASDYPLPGNNAPGHEKVTLKKKSRIK